jgi:hypothetical protein
MVQLAQITGAVPAVSTITRQTIDWLWPGWVARGVLTLIDGDPGMGKSTLAVDLAARVSRGRGGPGAPDTGKPQGVLLLSAEDDPGRVIRPRLDAAGADNDRVFVLECLPGQPDRPVMLPQDAGVLQDIIQKQQVGLVIVDPLMAFLGRGVNVQSDQDVRRALHRLKRVAEQTQAALVIVRHLNKSSHMAALYRGGGSIGIVGACRVALVVGKDPADDQRRVLATNKNNLVAKPPSWGFRLEERGSVAVVVWDGQCDWSAEEVLGKMSEEQAEELSRVQECAEAVRGCLGNGRMLTRDLETMCGALGFSVTTIKRARKKLGVRASKNSFGGWEVELRTEARGSADQAQKP